VPGIVAEGIGWAGAGCLLLAYALLSAGRQTAGTGYQLLNLAGAVGLAGNAVVHRAWPSATLNLIWLVVGLLALLAGLAHRRRSPENRNPQPEDSATPAA
jgi:hypothetical protein